MLHQKVSHQHSHIGWEQLVFFDAGVFFRFARYYFFSLHRNGSEFAFHSFPTFLHHVQTFLNRRDGRSVGGRSAYAEFLEFFHQSGFVVTGWWTAETLGGGEFAQVELVAGGKRWQNS